MDTRCTDGSRSADPRGRSDAEIRELIMNTRPHYHFIGGLHSGETGPSEMLMELVYRLATETSPLITQIRNNVIVSVTPAAEPDGRDRQSDQHRDRGVEIARVDKVDMSRDRVLVRGERRGLVARSERRFGLHEL